MPTSSIHRTTLSEVGRIGCLDLDYEQQGHRTVLARSRCSSPWHFFPPMYLDSSGCAFTSLVNPSGGLVAGDHLSIQASVGPDAHVVLSTPSANRIYRSLVGEARQTVRLSVASGGILEWFPEITIPFADSRFVQTIDIRLAEGSTALIWDSLASGRVARGERWQFECLQNEIQITVASGSRLLERCEITPRQSHAGLALAYDYAASLFIACDAFDRKTWSLLREDLADVLDEMGDELLGGVTEPPIPGLAVKVVTRSAEGLAAVQAALWDAVRIRILGLPRPELRRY